MQEVVEVPLCQGRELQDGGLAVPFDVVYCGQTMRGFAVRWQGRVYAYLNRCAHVAMEMDFRPNQFFDGTGQWLMCATHGAIYEPHTGECRGGPCTGARLIPVGITERDGVVHWHRTHKLQPVEF